MIKQCNAITIENKFSLYRKSRENRDEKNGSEKLIKSAKSRLAGALSNKPLVRFIYNLNWKRRRLQAEYISYYM